MKVRSLEEEKTVKQICYELGAKKLFCQLYGVLILGSRGVFSINLVMSMKRRRGRWLSNHSQFRLKKPHTWLLNSKNLGFFILPNLGWKNKLGWGPAGSAIYILNPWKKRKGAQKICPWKNHINLTKWNIPALPSLLEQKNRVQFRS